MNAVQKWIAQWADEEGFRPIYTLWLGASVALVVFLAAAFAVWDAKLKMMAVEDKASLLCKQVSELLTMQGARTAAIHDAVTGKDTSGILLNDQAGHISESTADIEKLGREMRIASVSTLRDVNAQMGHMQDSAIELMRAGHWEAAHFLIKGDDYDSLTRQLGNSAHQVTEVSMVRSEAANRRFTARLWWVSIVLGIFFTALSVAWLAVMRLVRRHLLSRRKTESDLRESEEKYRHLIEALPQGVLISQDDRFVFCNETAASILGAESPEHLLSVPPLSLVLESDREATNAVIAARRRREESAPERRSMTLRRVDGTLILAEVFARDVTYRGRDATQYVLQDVTEREQSEQSLRESEEKYRTLIEALPHPVVINRGLKVAFCNPAAVRAFGFNSSEEMLGIDYPQLVPERERPRVTDYAERRVKGDAELPNHYAMAFLRRNQEEFPGEVFVQRVSYGGVPAAQVVILDVTERQRAESALRESEERFRNLSDTAPVLIWMAGVGRHTFYFNKMWLKFTGQSITQLYGHGWKESAHPEDLPRCLAAYQGAFESRAPFMVEYRLRHMDGTYHWVLDTGVPRFTADGSFAGYVGSCVDITARRATEEALRESEQRFRELTDFLPHTIFETDERGTLTFVNRKGFELFGYGVQDLQRGVNVFEILSDGDRPRARLNVERILKGETIGTNEYKALTRSGRRFPVMVDSTARMVNGKPCGLRGMVIDISDRKRAEEELSQVNRALKATGECNQALVHANEEITLLNDVCRIIVHTGGHRMAWVGYVQEEAGKTVRPVAHAGSEQGYLRAITVTYDDTGTGDGPIGLAIRTGKPSVNRDIAAGAVPIPWRAEAIKRGYRSVISLPLASAGACLGVLSIYSGEAEAFDATEVKLLSQLADDLSYGIEALRTREERVRTEMALKDSELTLRRTFDQSPIGAAMVALDGSFLRVNETFCEMLGYTADELKMLTFRSITHPDELPRDEKQVALLAAGEIDLYETEKRYVCKDGSVLWGHLSVSSVKDADGKVIHFLPMVQDITTRIQAERLLHEQASAIEAAMDGMAIVDESGCYLYMNDAHAKVYGYAKASELIGRSWEMLYDANELKRFHEIIIPSLTARGHWRGAATGRKRDGSTFPQELSLSRTDTGGLVCIVRDTSDRCGVETTSALLARLLPQGAPPEKLHELLAEVRRQLTTMLPA